MKKVYQIQPQNNKATIMHVGNLSKIFDQNIKTFDIQKFKCHMTSKIYDIDTLQPYLSIKQIPIINISICINNNNYPSAHLSYNFIPNNIGDEYVSTKENIILIDGNYTITLHLINGKYTTLETNIKYTNPQTMMDQLIAYLCDDSVMQMI